MPEVSSLASSSSLKNMTPETPVTREIPLAAGKTVEHSISLSVDSILEMIYNMHTSTETLFLFTTYTSSQYYKDTVIVCCTWETVEEIFVRSIVDEKG